jgi:hypothetical protein
MSGRLNFWMTAIWSAVLGVGLALAVSWFWKSEQADAAAHLPVDVLETRLADSRGRTVWIELRAVRRRDRALTATTQWQGKDRIINSRFNPNKAVLTEGKERWIRRRIDLPERTPVGAYLVRSVAEYLCPDGQTFVVPTGWLTMEIIP